MSLCGFFVTSLLTFSADFLQSRGGRALGQEVTHPELVQVSSGVPSGVVLRCKTPAGHSGQVFQLYHLQTLVDTKQFNTEQSYADFHLITRPADTEQLYCCRYDNNAFSPYTRLLPPVELPAPELSLGGKGVLVCTGPPSYPGAHFTLFQQGSSLPLATQTAKLIEHSVQFTASGQQGGGRGRYECQYSALLGTNWAHSPRSSPITLSFVTVELPAPELSLGGKGVLVCTGPPSYPGAHFTLFQQGSSLPLATQTAKLIEHSVQFTASGQQGEGGGRYECQYSALLGTNWAHSPRSSPITLSCVTGSSSCSLPTENHPPQTSSMDLALVCGSVSAALLFLMVLILLAFGIRKYAETAAKNRRQREQEQFWQQVHSRDHIVDLTLPRVSTGSKEDRGASVSEPIYDCPFSTFTHPLG